MHKRLILLLIVLVFFLSSCALNKIDKSELGKNLDSEIKLWSDFRIEGIMKLYVSEYNLIKDITIIKDSTQMKLVLYDTGLFGFSPKPFASFVFNDSIAIDIPSIKDPGQLEQIRSIAGGLTIFHEGFFDELEKENDLADLIKYHIFETQNMILEFNKMLQLTTVKMNDAEIEIRIIREFSLPPEEIEVYYQNKLLVIIEIDKFIRN